VKEVPSSLETKTDSKKSARTKTRPLKKVFLRYAMILACEIVFSLLSYLLVHLRRGYGFAFAVHIGSLLGFGVLMYRMARKIRHRTHLMRHYYLYNLTALFLFLLTAALTYIFNRGSILFPDQSVYFSYFRLSYIIGMLDDGTIHVEECALSISVFFAVTFAVFLLEPLWSKLRHKLQCRRHKRRAASKFGK